MIRCQTITLAAAAAAALSIGAGPPSDDLMRYVPDDAMVVLAGRLLPRSLPATAPAEGEAGTVFLQQVLAVGLQLRLLPEDVRLLGDVLGTLPLLSRHPCVFALLDVSSQPVAGRSYRLEQMQAGLVLLTGGDHEAVTQRIQQLLAAYTNTATSRLTKTSAPGKTRYRLSDSRLPPWAVIEWSAMHDRFLVTLGEGAFERMAAVTDETALCTDPWYVTARRQVRSGEAVFECVIAAQRLRERLDEVIQGRPDHVLRALGAGSLDRLCFVVGAEGRAVVSRVMIRTDEGDEVFPLSESVAPGSPAAGAIPAQASSYMSLRLPLGPWVRRVRDAYLASRSPEAGMRLRTAWTRIEERAGVRFEEDLLDRLGSRLIVHDYPPHPLHIPFLWTYLLETDGDEEALRRTLDAWMGALQSELQARTGRPDAGLAPRLNRTRDGIWFLQLGIAGPAVGVCGHWIIFGYSPESVRRNAAFLRGPTSGAAPVDTPSDHR